MWREETLAFKKKKMKIISYESQIEKKKRKKRRGKGIFVGNLPWKYERTALSGVAQQNQFLIFPFYLFLYFQLLAFNSFFLSFFLFLIHS